MLKLALISTVVTVIAVRKAFAGHAHSFAHFHGPVEGPAKEVYIHDGYGGHRRDGYVAYPKYEFSYGVDDHRTRDHHRQKEHRDGQKVVGEYAFKEPGGNVRIVKYHADPHGGFFADVRNSDGNNHEGGTYGGYNGREGIGAGWIG